MLVEVEAGDLSRPRGQRPDMLGGQGRLCNALRRKIYDNEWGLSEFWADRCPCKFSRRITCGGVGGAQGAERFCAAPRMQTLGQFVS